MKSLNLTRLIERLIIALERHPQDAALCDALRDAIEALKGYRDDALPLGYRLAGMLDCAQPYLDAAADRERKAEAGKTLRQTTCYHRANAALKAVEQAEDVFGFSP
jgi:hypothetical protein